MAVSILKVVIDVLMFAILLPFLILFIANAENITATQTILLSLVVLFLILGLVFGVIKSSGLMKK